MIPAGKYNARGVEAALGYTNGGKEQVAVELVILDGEYQGHSITWYGYFTDKTTDRTLESLKLLGWPCDNLFDLSGIDTNDVSITIEEEPDEQGEQRSRVRWINKPGGGGPALKERMTDEQARAFSARMKGAMLASKINGGAKPTPAARPVPAQRALPLKRNEAPAQVDDDDIPY